MAHVLTLEIILRACACQAHQPLLRLNAHPIGVVGSTLIELWLSVLLLYSDLQQRPRSYVGLDVGTTTIQKANDCCQAAVYNCSRSVLCNCTSELPPSCHVVLGVRWTRMSVTCPGPKLRRSKCQHSRQFAARFSKDLVRMSKIPSHTVHRHTRACYLHV